MIQQANSLIRPPQDRIGLRHPGVWLFILALAIRLVALPFATLDSPDSPARVFISWLWSEHPHYISAGGWGPLHYYLIGIVMRLWPDPVWSPAMLHIFFGALASLGVYLLSLEFFGSRRGAIVAGLGFAIYPLAIETSLEAEPEIPCVALLLFGMCHLVRAWRPDGRLRDALIAGTLVTLASALRYEIWMILPFLAVPLLLQWKKLAAFLATAMLHPVAWMVGCFIRFGNPLYSFLWSDDFERNTMSHATEPYGAILVRKAVELGKTTVHGLSVPLAVLIALGVAVALLRRRREAIWLFAPQMLFMLVVFAGARGSLWYNPPYTLFYGALTMPFIAVLLQSSGVESWSIKRFWATAACVFAVVAATEVGPLWRQVPHGGVMLTEPVGEFFQQHESQQLLSLINGGEPVGARPLVMDFIGWEPEAFVLSRSKVHPEALCTPSGVPVPVDLPAIQKFLLGHREGTLVSYDKGRLTAEIQTQSVDTVGLAGVTLQLSKPRLLPWSGSQTKGAEQPGTLTVSDYRVVAEPVVRDSRPPACSTPCPVSLCNI